MVNNSDKEAELLHSWKEISQHLKVEVRTCQRWEKQYGLPIHRFTDSTRSRVFAYKNELDEWLKKYKNNHDIIDGKTAISRKRLLKYSFYIILISFISLSLYYILKSNKISQPFDFRIDGTNVVIVDKNDKELWMFDTGIKDLISESEYKECFQHKKPGSIGLVLLPLIIINDIDKDNKNEVLFAIRALNQFGTREFYYFNHRGEKLWTFKAEHKIKYGSETFDGDFRVTGIQVCDLNSDGENEIILIVAHWPRFPTQLVILNLKGEKIGEYWNSGRLNDLLFIDLDGDNKKEIVACGTNNEYKKGCLVVFDGDQIHGGSPQKIEEYKCNNLKAGSEKYYILLPRTDIELINYAITSCGQINILESKNISVQIVDTKNYFIFDTDFEIQGVTITHTFAMMHKEAVRSGKINSTLNKQYKEDLKKGILYWNGYEWTTTPSMSNPW
jgi:hypothetical protein